MLCHRESGYEKKDKTRIVRLFRKQGMWYISMFWGSYEEDRRVQDALQMYDSIILYALTKTLLDIQN